MTHWTEQKGPAHEAFEAFERACGHRISEYRSCCYMDDDQDYRWRSFERVWPAIRTAARAAERADRKQRQALAAAQ